MSDSPTATAAAAAEIPPVVNLDEVEDDGAELDPDLPPHQLDPRQKELLAGAQRRIRSGWAIIHVHHMKPNGVCSCSNWATSKCGDSAGKHPVRTGWTSDDPMEQAQAWEIWGNPDNAKPWNVGVRTGAVSGFFVLDIDPKGGGDEALARLLSEHGPFPRTVTARTGSGGEHYYFAMPEFDIRNSVRRVAEGIDVRANGGQVVAPPSVSGVGSYSWTTDPDTPIAEAPEWLLDMLRPSAAQLAVAEEPIVHADGLPEMESLSPSERTRVERYARAAVASEADLYANAPAGGGNDALFTAACNCFEIAQSPWNPVTADDVAAALDAARLRRAKWRQDGGQDPMEFSKTVASARSKVVGRGRKLPPDLEQRVRLGFDTADLKGASFEPFEVVRESETQDGPVLVVEGSQHAHVASCSPEEWTVCSVAPNQGWMPDGVPTPLLSTVEGRRVVIAPHGDVAGDRDAYDAASALREACDAEGAASVSFMRLPVGKNAGLDDILAAQPEERRTAYLGRLLEVAKTKPADVKPEKLRKKGLSPEEREAQRRALEEHAAGRVVIDVSQDRLSVIRGITGAMAGAEGGSKFFGYGGAIARVDGHVVTPLDNDAFLNAIQEVAITGVPNSDSDTGFAYRWPDDPTVKACRARASDYVPLDEVRRAPFVRPDGSICQRPGYDEATRTLLVLDEKLGEVDVPDDPTPEQVRAAAALIMEDWLHDFMSIMPDHASRANTLALLLTPLVRGMFPIAPLTLVSGLQMGVGKNKLANALSIIATGELVDPLPFTTDEEEQRKAMTAAFRSGATLMVFDEAHEIRGTTLARTLTGPTYTDRLLGSSQQLQLPNKATFLALGNNIKVEGDVARRVCWIELRPSTPNPENRPNSAFRHPDFETWTATNRGRLLGALLTLVRAWAAAGRPSPRAGVSFGSFEGWQRVVGGILEHAGVEGFLSNQAQSRAESDFNEQYWTAHLTWLHEMFAGNEFTAADVTGALQRALRDREDNCPPDLTDPHATGYSRSLGKAYHRQRDRYHGPYRLVSDRKGGQGKTKWRVERLVDTAPSALKAA